MPSVKNSDPNLQVLLLSALFGFAGEYCAACLVSSVGR